MSEETRPPFFINLKRLQRADSYFDIGRAQDRIRRFLEQKRNPTNVVLTQDTEQVEEYGLVGYYGVDRLIKLDDTAEEESSEEEEEEEDGGFFDYLDEDTQYQNTNMFSLFWMTFKNVAASISSHFSRSKPLAVRNNQDPESSAGGTDSNSSNDLCKILVHPPTHDPRIKEDLIVYGDMKYLVQKFRLSLKRGSVDVALFSVELPESNQISTGGITDLQTFVVSPECGSLVWIEQGRASAIFMTKSTTDFFGSIMGWFRKLLSDMALADSVMIGHPYYWQPNVRRRLTRVMRYLKRLYGKLALKEKRRRKRLASLSGSEIEMICPREISKIVINEHPSKYLMSSGTTHETLDVLLEHLVAKWFRYQHHESQPGQSVEEIANAYTAHHPPPDTTTQEVTPPEKDFLESVTFLDFHPHQRDPFPGGISSQEFSSISLSSVVSLPSSLEDCRPDTNNNNNNSRRVGKDRNGNPLRASEGYHSSTSYDDLSGKHSRLEMYGSSSENLQSSESDLSHYRHPNAPT